MTWWIWLLIGLFIYWLIGFIILKYFDPWGIGGVLPMLADHRHRSLTACFLLLFFAWFTWPIQLIWREKR